MTGSENAWPSNSRIVGGNSGIQYRSEEIKERDGKKFEPFVVGGNQADIASERYMGILYSEKSRGIVQDVSGQLVTRFADCLKAQLAASTTGTEEAAAEAAPAKKKSRRRRWKKKPGAAPATEQTP